jgi:hypothetical protein
MSDTLMRALGMDLNMFVKWFSLDPDATWNDIPDDARPLIEYRPDFICADGW